MVNAHVVCATLERVEKKRAGRKGPQAEPPTPRGQSALDWLPQTAQYLAWVLEFQKCHENKTAKRFGYCLQFPCLGQSGGSLSKIAPPCLTEQSAEAEPFKGSLATLKTKRSKIALAYKSAIKKAKSSASSCASQISQNIPVLGIVFGDESLLSIPTWIFADSCQ